MNEAIAHAIEILGSRIALAKICGVSHTAVNKWLKGGGISVVLARKIENATNGEVTMHQIAEGVKDE